MRNAREKTGKQESMTKGGDHPFPMKKYRGRAALSRLARAMKEPELEEGSVYAERWAAGARSLDEVAPSMAAWVRWRGVRRGALAVASMLAAICVAALLGPSLT